MRLIRKIFSKEDSSNRDLSIATGVAGLGGAVLGDKLIQNYNKGVDMNTLFRLDPKHIKESSDLAEKVKNLASSKGINVVNTNMLGSSQAAYVKNSPTLTKVYDKHIRPRLEKGLKSNPHKFEKLVGGGSIRDLDTVMDYMRPKEGTMLYGSRHIDSGEVLAHELGHSEYFRKSGNGGVIGKTAHKLMPTSKLLLTKPGLVGLGVNGFVSGRKAVKEGEAESNWNKVRAVAVPALAMSPMLVAEGLASRKGLQILKSQGASEEFLKAAKTPLKKAWGTYARASARPVLAGVGGRGLGRVSAHIEEEVKERFKK